MRNPSQGPVIASTMSQTESRKRAAPHLAASRDAKRIRPNTGLGTEKENDSGKDEKALMDDLMAGLDASMFDGMGSSPVKSQSLSQGLTGRKPQPSPLGSRSDAGERPRADRSPLGSTRPINVPRAFARPSPKKSLLLKSESVVKVESKPASRAFRPIPTPVKVELEARAPSLEIKEVTANLVKTASKPILLDEEDEFTFDFDLDEFAHMDDDLLLKPHAAAMVSRCQ
jgi:hypothetical protein